MKRKAERKRVAKEAKRNISLAIDRNLKILGDYLLRENGDTSELRCIREQCFADRECRELLDEAVRVLEETKTSFCSKKLMELRERIKAALKNM